MRILLITTVLLAAICQATGAATLQVQGGQPDESLSQAKKYNEAFATYVGWASDELERNSRPLMSFGLARIPMGLEESPSVRAAEAVFNSREIERQAPWIVHRRTSLSGIPAVGLAVNLPGGFSYELQYGNGRKRSLPGLFKGLERSLSANISRIEVDHAVGGVFRWQTPVEGFTLKGGISQIHLRADAVTLPSTIWSRMGVHANEPGRLFSRANTWRAGAEHRVGNLKLSAEYMQSYVDVSFNEGEPVSRIGEGYIGSAAYRVTDWLQLGSSYSMYYADRTDREGEALTALGRDPAGAWIRDFGVSARFDFNSRIALQVEGHIMNGLLGAAEGSDEDWRRFGANMTIQF